MNILIFVYRPSFALIGLVRYYICNFVMSSSYPNPNPKQLTTGGTDHEGESEGNISVSAWFPFSVMYAIINPIFHCTSTC